MKLKKKLYTLFEKQTSIHTNYYIYHKRHKKLQSFTKFWWFHPEITGPSELFF
jgi:hypothetical protein